MAANAAGFEISSHKVFFGILHSSFAAESGFEAY